MTQYAWDQPSGAAGVSDPMSDFNNMATDPNIVDVTYQGINYQGRSVTPIAYGSNSVAVIDDETGSITTIGLNQADSYFGRENLIIIDPSQAMPTANDSIVVVPPAGPLAVPGGGGSIQRRATPGALIPREPAGPPTVGQLGGLLGKESSRMAKILGKLGRAGKLVGPIAGVAALLLQAIEAVQRIFGNGQEQADKGGKYNGGDNEGVPGTVPNAGGTMSGSTAGAVDLSTVTKLENMDMANLLVEADCGGFGAFAACACDPLLRRGIMAIESRFTMSEQTLLYRKFCGCPPKLAPAVPSTPMHPQPTIGPTIPVINPPSPAPAPLPNIKPDVPQPSNACYIDTAPPVGTYPTGYFKK